MPGIWAASINHRWNGCWNACECLFALVNVCLEVDFTSFFWQETPKVERMKKIAWCSFKVVSWKIVHRFSVAAAVIPLYDFPYKVFVGDVCKRSQSKISVLTLY